MFSKVPLLIALLRESRGRGPLALKDLLPFHHRPFPLVDSKEVHFAGKLRRDLVHGSPGEAKGQISLLTKTSN